MPLSRLNEGFEIELEGIAFGMVDRQGHRWRCLITDRVLSDAIGGARRLAPKFRFVRLSVHLLVGKIKNDRRHLLLCSTPRASSGNLSCRRLNTLSVMRHRHLCVPAYPPCRKLFLLTQSQILHSSATKASAAPPRAVLSLLPSRRHHGSRTRHASAGRA